MEKEPTSPPPDRDNKIKEYGRDKLEEGDLVRYRSKLYRVIRHDTGFTVREFYSHSTEEKGPGPGWDNRWPVLERYGVDEPSDLPDTPHTRLELEPVEDDNSK